MDLPKAGLLQLHDAESGELAVINTSSQRLRARFREQALAREHEFQRFFKSQGLDYLLLNTAENYVDPLIKFFKRRAARMR